MSHVLKFAGACGVVFGLLLGCQPAREVYNVQDFDRSERCLVQGGTVTFDKHGHFIGCNIPAWKEQKA